jgi:carboxypeptidase Q
LLSDCGLKPKRTIRAVLFVDEEVRQTGAKAYCEAHKHESDKIVAAIETDLGAGTVCGFGYSGTDEARILLREILSPLKFLGDVANINSNWSGKGVDISPLIEECNVPGLLLRHR